MTASKWPGEVVVADVVVAEGDAAAVWPDCPTAQAVSTAKSARVTDLRSIIKKVTHRNFNREQVLMSKNKERFWRRRSIKT